MNKKQVAMAVSLAVTGVVMGAAQADPIGLPGDTPLVITYNDAEQVCLTNCIGNTSGSTDASGNAITWNEGNWGIVRVRDIFTGNPTGFPNSDISDTLPKIFSYGDASTPGAITGIFYGINFLQDASGNPIPTAANGGVLDLYWHEATGNYTPSDELNAGLAASVDTKRTAQDAYTGYTDGTFLVRLDFVPGDVAWMDASVPNDATVYTPASPASTTASSAAYSYQVVDTSKVGVWTDILASSWFLNNDNGGALPTAADFRTQSNYNYNSGWSDLPNGIFGLISNDPVRAYTVPEPSEVALLGIGLAGLATMARRRKKAKAQDA